MLDWISNSPIVKLQIESWSYFTGLGANEYWGAVAGLVLSSVAPAFSSLSSVATYLQGSTMPQTRACGWGISL